MNAAETHWLEHAKAALVGKSVTSVSYMTKEEAAEIGWYSRPLVIQFDDGNFLFAMSDDEGNDGGALAYGESETFPVMRT